MVFHETQINVMKHIDISWNMSFFKSQSEASMNLSVLVEM